MTTRWTFDDAVGDETWTVPINPDSMTSPEPPAKQLRHARGTAADPNGARTVTKLGKPIANDWEFSGAIRTKAHHDLLEHWSEKTNEITITDHLARQWLVYITDFVPVDRSPTPNTPWRMRYTVKTKIIARIA